MEKTSKVMPEQMQAHDSLKCHYDELVASGHIRNDEAQRQVLAALQTLIASLPAQQESNGIRAQIAKWIPGLRYAAPATATTGIYIWGNVGRGKSMLMDLFFENAPIAKKRRVHFHAFMQEVHARLHELRNAHHYQGDPVVTLAKEISDTTRLLCFDELQASDPADASLLHRLFSGLFEHSVVIVSTSNHPPSSLYTGGVQRERFDKFIALIEKNMQVLALSSDSDYRMTQIKSLQSRYFTPLGKEADAFIEETIKRLGLGAAPRDDVLSVQGRVTHFHFYPPKTGLFSFDDLCRKNLGAIDYLALARRLDTVILTDIPTLSPEQRNEAKRFVTLIDALYENKVKLVCTAATLPEGVYTDGDGSFEFKRTVSRLAEMQGEKWITG